MGGTWIRSRCRNRAIHGCHGDRYHRDRGLRETSLVAAKDDSRARTRPALAAYLECELLSHGAILLVVKNFGPSSATDVRVAFDPPAPSTQDVARLPDSDMTKWLYQRLGTTVPNCPPGWSTTNVIRGGQDPLDPLTVTLSYFGPDGTHYEERFPLHPDHILKETSSTPSKSDDPVKLGQQGVSGGCPEFRGTSVAAR